jgi:serine/threonine-protein kinase
MAGLAKRPEHRPTTAAAFAEAINLPEGTTPEHLLVGARSAVSPIVALNGSL